MSQGGGLFEVVYSQVIRNHLQELIGQAANKDKSLMDTILPALKTLDRKMRETPFELGEPRFNYEHLRLHVRIAVEHPLAISFAVHTDRPIVFVQAIQLLSTQ